MRFFPQFPNGLSKCLTLSYDDSTIHNLRLVDIFNKYNLKATFHLNSALLGYPDQITEADVSDKLAAAGHEISCHTATHPFLDRIPPMEAMREVWDDRTTLERLAGYPVIGMSYPYGTYNPQVLEMIKNAGIVYSRTTQATNRFFLPADYLAWHPTCHHRDCMGLVETFLKSPYPCSCFYVWGHAYEFDRNNNWEYIEEFAKAVAKRDDVWYGTNIEIYRYDTAMKSLVFSTERTMVHNPSALTVWFAIGDKNYCVAPGETIGLE